MNKWNITVKNKKEYKLVLVQKGLAFYFETDDGKLVNPFFHDSEVAKIIFEPNGIFLETLGDMLIQAQNGVEIEIQAQ